MPRWPDKSIADSSLLDCRLGELAMRHIVIAASLAGVVIATNNSRGATDYELQEQAIRAIGPEFSVNCLNRSDARTCAQFWADDGSLVTPDGTRVDGPEEIQKLLARDLTNLFKGSRSQCTIQTVHWLRPDLAFIDMEHALTGLTHPDGGAIPAQKLQYAATVVNRANRWMFMDVRTYVVLPPPERRAVDGCGNQVLTLIGRPLALPGASGEPIVMDYLATDRSSGRIWVPAGNTGSVMVIDGQNGSIRRIDGFKTLEQDILGERWKVGPSAAAVGDGVVYVGNRGDSKICAVDSNSLKSGRCISVGPASGGLASSADGIAYVASTKELWVTLGAPGLGFIPSWRGLLVYDARVPNELRLKHRIPIPGVAEGYAVDERRGIFYTNLEEQDRTLGINVRNHRIVFNASAGCGKEGPRGLALDEERNFVFVACTDRINTLDAGHAGAKLSSFEAGTGIDNIDYLGARKQLYVAAGKSALLTVFGVDDRGELIKLASAPTAKGARVVVADARGTAYVADSSGARIIEFELQPKAR